MGRGGGCYIFKTSLIEHKSSLGSQDGRVAFASKANAARLKQQIVSALSGRLGGWLPPRRRGNRCTIALACFSALVLIAIKQLLQ